LEIALIPATDTFLGPTIKGIDNLVLTGIEDAVIATPKVGDAFCTHIL
jgi:hypothetical protein